MASRAAETVLRLVHRRVRFLLPASLALAALPALSALSLAASSVKGSTVSGEPFSVLQGTLVVAGQSAARLATRTGDIVLNSESPSLLHTLQDPRLNGRLVRLEGRANADGSFDASHLYIVRDGKLYKLRYYCHVCNIAATEPGPCVCCQRPTDLEEIPVSEVTDDLVTVP
jgi:hypothetical protein